jgi:hypothetical protein
VDPDSDVYVLIHDGPDQQHGLKRHRNIMIYVKNCLKIKGKIKKSVPVWYL